MLFEIEFSSNLTPRFNTEVAGVVLRLEICVEKKPLSFLHCIGVPVMRNSVFGFSFISILEAVLKLT